MTAAGHPAGGYVIEPVFRVEASLHRGSGGNPKSSLGGPRTAHEVAGSLHLHHQPVAQRLARFELEARVRVGHRGG